MLPIANGPGFVASRSLHIIRKYANRIVKNLGFLLTVNFDEAKRADDVAFLVIWTGRSG
jgi:hypothetical protein